MASSGSQRFRCEQQVGLPRARHRDGCLAAIQVLRPWEGDLRVRHVAQRRTSKRLAFQWPLLCFVLNGAGHLLPRNGRFEATWGSAGGNVRFGLRRPVAKWGSESRGLEHLACPSASALGRGLGGSVLWPVHSHGCPVCCACVRSAGQETSCRPRCRYKSIVVL